MINILGVKIGKKQPVAAIQPAAAPAHSPTLEEEINRALDYVEKQPPSNFSVEEATQYLARLAEYQTAKEAYDDALASLGSKYHRMSAAELVGHVNASQDDLSAKMIISDISRMVKTIHAKRVGASVRGSGEEITPEAIKAHLVATRDVRTFDYLISVSPNTISKLISMGDNLSLETAVGAIPDCVTLISDTLMKETPEYEQLTAQKDALDTLDSQLKRYVKATRTPKRELIFYEGPDMKTNTGLGVTLNESQDRQKGIVTYSGNVYSLPVVTFKSDDPKHLRLDLLASASERLVLQGLKVTNGGGGRVKVGDNWTVGITNGSPHFYFNSELAADSPQGVKGDLQVLRALLPVLYETVAAGAKGELYSKAAPAPRA